MGKPTKQLNRQLGGWGKSTQWGKDKGKITVKKSEKVPGNYIFLPKIIHNVCVNVSIWDGNALSKSFRLCSKAPNSRHEKKPYKLLVKGVQDASKIVAYCCCFFFFCLPEVERKFLLLKISCTSETGLKLDFTGKQFWWNFWISSTFRRASSHGTRRHHASF